MEKGRRDFITTAGALLVASGASGWAMPAAARTSSPRRRRRGNDEVLRQLVSVKQGPDSLPYVAMTFDDGPHPAVWGKIGILPIIPIPMMTTPPSSGAPEPRLPTGMVTA